MKIRIMSLVYFIVFPFWALFKWITRYGHIGLCHLNDDFMWLFGHCWSANYDDEIYYATDAYFPPHSVFMWREYAFFPRWWWLFKRIFLGEDVDSD